MGKPVGLNLKSQPIICTQGLTVSTASLGLCYELLLKPLHFRHTSSRLSTGSTAPQPEPSTKKMVMTPKFPDNFTTAHSIS